MGGLWPEIKYMCQKIILIREGSRMQKHLYP